MAARTAISFDVFGYIHDSRQTYGLRADDYTRYRRFCAHHLRTVRKAAKLAQGTSTAYRPKPVTADTASKPEHLEILVLEAERAWAYAMDLRELYSRTEEPRQRYHVIRRLKAACKTGEHLASVASAVGDRRTKLASFAYWQLIRAQLHFELEEWVAALDSAVLSRVVCKQLALTGSSKQYALAHVMIESLDAIVRLSAYQARVGGAQQMQPAELTEQWYDARIKGEPARIESAIPEYAAISRDLVELSEASEHPEEAGDSAGYANQLQWRGGSIGYPSAEMASLIDAAQAALKSAVESESKQALDTATAAFKRAKKTARTLHGEGVAASEKIGSSASDALLSAYLAIQLYSICALQAISVSRYVAKADGIAAKLGAAAGSTGLSFSGTSAWFENSADAGRASAGKKQTPSSSLSVDRLPEATQMVVLYDMARKNLSQLRKATAGVLDKLSPGMGRAIGATRIADEVAVAEAYYSGARDYYSAVLHAQPRHRRYLDALALLNTVQSEQMPRARSLARALDTKAGGLALSSGEVVDGLWVRVAGVSEEKLAAVETSVAAAVPVIHGLCEASAGAKKASADGAKGDWFENPGSQPVMVPSKLAAKRQRSGKKTTAASAAVRVPKLVDLDRIEFEPVPIKPLFYDLAGSSIDFDAAAIDARAGKQAASGGGSKISSIIGSLWGSR
ncbi:signal recognition particle subunit srp68 [Coemansia sp. Benny D115]|nr:signal recognition particle subunit srp68 [Coemansia sp. Benny D115]